MLYLNHSIKDRLGWKEGDKFKVDVGHDSITISKVKN